MSDHRHPYAGHPAALILADHRAWSGWSVTSPTRCDCGGWTGPSCDHPAHLAEVLHRAGLLADGRIRAALSLHPPCHDPDPAKWAHDWDCIYGHSLEDGRIDPDEPPRCTYCTYDARTVEWPCPTVQALAPPEIPETLTARVLAERAERRTT